MKPLRDPFVDLGAMSVYDYIHVISPAGDHHYAEYHGDGPRILGEPIRVVRAWTGFGEPVMITCDGSWQAEKCRRDVFENFTGLPAQPKPDQASPWYIPTKRSPIVRAILKLADQYPSLRAPDRGLRLMELVAHHDVDDVHRFSSMYNDDLTRTATWAHEHYAERGFPVEWTLLKWAIRHAMSAWDIYSDGKRLNPEPQSIEDAMEMICMTEVGALIARLPEAIEAERAIWREEIKDWAEAVEIEKPQQMELTT